MDNEDHMPPKNKAQLTRQQISVLQWWVNTGADFNKKVSDLKQDGSIKPTLLALESGIAAPETEVTEIPEEPVIAADSIILKKLSAQGVIVMPVSRNSNYLSVSFVTVSNKADTLVSALEPLKKQLVSLKLDDSNVSDSTLTAISNFSNLRRLQLSNTEITDKGLMKLKKLKDLGSLNLMGTKVTAKGIVELKELKSLKYLYLYQTAVTPQERDQLKQSFPETAIDFGDYTVPTLVTDTTEVNINVKQ
jgi:Leucine-rich repeat (LRR) protein